MQANSSRHISILSAIGARVRPYIVRFASDFLIAATLWLLLWFFKKLTSLAPIGGWPGEYFVHIHSIGTVVAYGVLMGLLVWDIIEIHKREREHGNGF